MEHLQEYYSQKYVLLYCKYDSESGYHPLHQLTYQQIEAINENIARSAFQDIKCPKEAAKINNFGSPNAQDIVDTQKRLS